MGECEGEDDIISAANYIMKVLELKRNFTNDTRQLLADLGSQLCSMANMTETDKACEEDDDGDDGAEDLSELEYRLIRVHDKIMTWELTQSTIWDSGSDEANDYLEAVNEVRKLTVILEDSKLIKNGKGNELLRKGYDVLQTSMARLEEEFMHILVHNRVPFEPEHVSFRSNEEDVMDSVSTLSFDESIEFVAQRDSSMSVSMNINRGPVDLVHPSVIPYLKSIVKSMFDSSYDKECTQAFVSVRREALDDCLFILEVDKLSIEDVLKMEWGTLNSKIKKWMRAMKIFVRVNLASEKWLSDEILEDFQPVSSVCFVESSKASIMQLLNFGEAIAIGPHQPEKLSRILDMYEVLEELIPDIDSLFIGQSGSHVTTECRDILTRLGTCVKVTFLEFQNAVASNVSPNSFAGGGIHPLTRYVMNYVNTLSDYTETLNVLLKEEDGSHSYFQSLISVLEINLDEKARLYKEESLGHVFLMNNIHYMAEKVKGSEVRTVLGDEWIRKRNWKFQQHAMNYEMTTWSSVLSLLRDEGISHSPNSNNSISKKHLKERLQSFYVAFEDVYKVQSGWSIPDTQLREDLRISTSLKVIQAYRSFIGKHKNTLSDKRIKYSADDLENYIFDLFDGAPRSLHNSHKK
ncbi:exocyst complex component EXO70E2-like [Impatiens glandulifera]|uniref:exocyst complex component EXO70E2-like n=1 Tax=Impatiens glandulifera TaxID=253017 RepID=UPI001FB060CA|nr:exocyst complex component EXO70E2-like [Impatiens glandulifera]